MPSPLRERAARTSTGAALGVLFGLLVKDLGLPSLVSYWHSRAPLVLLFALLFAVVWGSWRLTRLRTVLAVATALMWSLWLAVAFSPLVPRLAAHLPRRDEPAPSPPPADAVFVLSSSLQRDGELGRASMPRLLRALELLGEKRAARLVLSELYPPSPSYAIAAKPLMANLGLDAEVVTFGPVRNTRDEAVGLARLAKERGWTRVIVVTSPTHSRRACASIEHEGLSATCLPSTELGFDFETLARGDERVRAFESIAHEWIGLWVYRARGWIEGAAVPSPL